MNKALLKEAGTINHRHHEVMDRLEKIIDEGKSYKTMADLASMLKVSLRTLYEIAPSKDELINLTINNVLTKHGKIAMEKIPFKDWKNSSKPRSRSIWLLSRTSTSMRS